MRDESYLTPPEEIDMERAERTIRNTGLLALGAFAIAGAAAWFVLPLLWRFPEHLTERLAFGAQASALVLVWVLVGMGMVSTGRRFSRHDISGSAARPPSEKLAIQTAFLQNTLEQAVMAAGAYMAFASLVGGPWLALVVVAVAFFAVGRILFLRGYARGVQGRSLGMSLTAIPTMLGYLAVVALIVLSLF